MSGSSLKCRGSSRRRPSVSTAVSDALAPVLSEGAPPELQGDLILRIMPDTAVADREILVQSEVASQGFPAPQVRLTGDANAGLGRPFMVMDRVPGRTPVGEPSGTAALAQLGLAALRLPDLLARTVARLHALDPEPLRRSLAQLDTAVVDI